MDIELFEKIKKHQFDKLTDELGKIYAGVSVEDAENEIKEILMSLKFNLLEGGL